VNHGEAFQRCLFVVGVVVNESGWVRLQPRGNEVYRGLEGTFYSLPIMSPIRRELRFVIVHCNEAKEVFEPPVLAEQGSFHIEENVACTGRWQPSKTLARNQRERLGMVETGVALGDLQRRLMAESTEGLGLNSRNS
jgi:hypothetical protein